MADQPRASGLLSIADTCDLVAKLYDPANNAYWDHLFPVDGSYAAVKRLYSVDYVVWRGSTTAYDWIEDFTDIPVEIDGLGTVEKGFYDGVIGSADQIDAVLGPSIIICGHSLGAAHAQIHAGRRLAAGKPVSQIVIFGPPKPGFQNFADLLNATRTPELLIWGYRNCDDPVPEVPGIILPYVAPRVWFELNAPPPPDDPWGPAAAHHIELYQKGCRDLGI